MGRKNDVDKMQGFASLFNKVYLDVQDFILNVYKKHSCFKFITDIAYAIQSVNVTYISFVQSSELGEQPMVAQQCLAVASQLAEATGPRRPLICPRGERNSDANRVAEIKEVRGLYLAVHRRDECRLDAHAEGHPDVEELVEEEGVDDGRDGEEGGEEVALPRLHARVSRKVNQLTATRCASSI